MSVNLCRNHIFRYNPAKYDYNDMTWIKPLSEMCKNCLVTLANFLIGIWPDGWSHAICKLHVVEAKAWAEWESQKVGCRSCTYNSALWRRELFMKPTNLKLWICCSKNSVFSLFGCLSVNVPVGSRGPGGVTSQWLALVAQKPLLLLCLLCITLNCSTLEQRL